MILKQLILENFKGHAHTEINFSDSVTQIRATNGVGKSTLMDAYLWLIKGKDKRDRADYDIKTRTGDDVSHGLDHSVTGIFDDGTILKRVYREKWTKRRGSTESEFTGHETIYFIDDLEMKQSDYNARIQEMFGDGVLFSILSDPFFFSEMKWKDRRKIIAEICGEIDEKALYDQMEDPLMIASLLNGKTSDEVIARLKNLQKRINGELDEQKIRLSEATKAISRPDTSLDDLNKQLEEVSSKIKETRDEIKRVESGVADTSSLKNEASELSTRLFEMESERTSKHKAEERKHDQLVRDKTDRLTQLSSELNRKKLSADGLEEQMAFLRKEFATKKDEPEPSFDTVCFNCGAPIDPSKLDDQLSAWNQKKSETLESIRSKGVMLKGERDKLIAEISELNKQIETSTAELTKLRSKVFHVPAKTEEEEKLEADLKAIREKIASVQKADTSDLDAAIKLLENEKSEINQKIVEHQAAERQEKRIIEIQERQKELSEQYQDAYKQLCLVEEFLKIKMAAVESNVFDVLGVRVKMFNVQINGGIEDICDVLVECNGTLVPFQSANDGARNVTGINIIAKLQKHYGKELPVWIDNAESVVQYPKFDGQLVKLIVDEHYDTLTVLEEN